MAFSAWQKIRASDLNFPCCIVTRSVAQTGIATATPTAISFDTEAFDNASMFPGTGTTITITRAGVYMVTGYGAIESNATGYRRLLVELNGSSYPTIDERQAVTGDATHMTISATLPCIVGDTFKLFIEQASGGNRSTAGVPRFSVIYQSS